MRKVLRVHHVLCLPLFAGEGYSDGFSRNMSSVKSWLAEHMDDALDIVCAPDMICGDCPNLTKQRTCRDEDNHVEIKDRRLVGVLGLDQPAIYSWRELLEIALREMTEERFLASCGNCEWFRQGLCCYSAWKKRAEEIVQR
ncbi:MAG: DUF1284 domain-containing protein [Eubacteriales bacterium]|nr:DUF1284 domain-containing protein [Eubacteriales bacterium]